MHLIFYKISDDVRTVNKNIGNAVLTYNDVTLKDRTSLFNPTFILKRPSNFDVNYCFCSEFNRYYYINDIVFDGNLTLFSCHEDVLHTYADKIKELPAIIKRNENIYNNYLKDELIELTAKEVTSIITFGYDMQNDYNYYLTVSGGE